MRRIANSFKSVFSIAGVRPAFYFLVISLFFLLPSSIHAQGWVMPVDGKVLVNGSKTAGGIITLFKNGQQQQQVVTTSNGKFSFELLPNAEYIIAITKPGFVTKKFKIVTANVPSDRAEAGNFNPFEPDVSLFEMPTSPEIAKRVEAILSQPIAIYQYIPTENNFNYDEKYTQAIQSKLTELADLQKTVEKDMQEKAKNAALEAQKQLETDNKYKAAIAKADKALSTADYAMAKAGYNEALGVKPQETYPKQKLAEIDKLIANANSQKELDAKYQAAVNKGNTQFTAKDYASAKTSFTEASGLKPTEAYPKTKIAEIDKILGDAAKQKELDAKYQAAITKGDNAFSTKDYTTAKSGYTEAGGIKPSEAYPKQKIAEIDKLLADASKQKEIDEKYKAAITKGDNAFNSKDYATARSGYTEASGVKPGEAYPKTKLAEIDKLLSAADAAAKQKEIDDKYKAAIAKGDNAFNTKDYSTARSGYTEASGIKPGEAYPKQKLADIDKLLGDAAKQKEIDAKYQAAITKGDNAFSTKDYTTAKAGYTEAGGIKPNEAYPKTKLAEIDKLMSAADAAAKQKEIDAKYQAAITKGDNAFSTKDYTTAKSGYTEAGGIKPNEAYPKTKLAEIDKLMAAADAAAKQKEIDDKYKAAVSKGDNAFNAKDYITARSGYSDATGIKPNEAYPKAKLAEIDKLLGDAAKQKEIEAKYQAAISKGDNAFSSKDYTTAKAGYTEAVGIKPSEAYPKQKIAEIDKLISAAGAAAKQKEIDEKYKAAISKGDGSFASKEYAAAKTSFNEALGIKPAEQYPKNKIAEIDKLLAEMASAGALEQQYKDLIAKGDNLFAQKKYESARTAFSDASSLKYAELYPKNKIAEIDKLMKELAAQKSAAELDQKYKDAIAKGDKAYAAKDYPSAKLGYVEASGVKPSEAYPKTRIAEIDKLLSEASAKKELDDKYKASLAAGDKAFGARDYTSAQTSYLDASSLKPNEQYPKQKLAEIDKLLAAKEVVNQKDQRYNELISKGDMQFNSKDYLNAKNSFTQALGIKSENYPKQKVSEIDKILKDMDADKAAKELDKNYLAAVSRGDVAFKQNTFSNAKVAYNEALTYKPNEQYPKDKLAEIEKIEQARETSQASNEVLVKYNQCIERADKAFTVKDYMRAKPAYEEALSYKPNEKYPKQRLSQIEAIQKAALLAQNQSKEPKQKTPPVSEEEKKKIYMSELRAKYPAGVTEEEYNDNGKTILRRVVIRDDFAGVYTKVTHNWGGIYCFRDNIPITESTFENETK